MAQPAVIDLYPAEVDPDGTLVYRSPEQALAVHAVTCAHWLLAEHPRETFHVLALGLIAGACVWLASK